MIEYKDLIQWTGDNKAEVSKLHPDIISLDYDYFFWPRYKAIGFNRKFYGEDNKDYVSWAEIPMRAFIFRNKETGEIEYKTETEWETSYYQQSATI